MKRLIGATVALAIGGTCLAAQIAPLVFDVASIKVVEPLDVQKLVSGQQVPSSTTQTPGRVDIVGLPLGGLVAKAFKVKPNQIEGPAWLALDPIDQLHSGEARFDVHATFPAGVGADQVPEMLQALLVERFKLSFHRERKGQTGLALVVGKDGPKLMKAGDGAAKSGQPIRTSSGGMLHIERDLTMTQLTSLLSQILKTPVTDLTSLTDVYRVSLDLSSANVGAAAPDSLPGGATEPNRDVSAFKSVEQLGLKLESRKVLTEFIIIDHIEKLPTPN